jgi:hypothetical protein
MTLVYNKTLTNEFFATLGSTSPNGRYRVIPPQSPFSILDNSGPTYTYNTPSNALDFDQLDASVIDDDGTIYSLDGNSTPNFVKTPSFGASDIELLRFFDGSQGGMGQMSLFISPVDATRRIIFGTNDGFTLLADQRIYVYNPTLDSYDEFTSANSHFTGIPSVQDMYGDIWAFSWDGTTFKAWRAVDFGGSGTAAPDYSEVTLGITADAGVSATHTPSGWVVSLGNNEVLALLSDDDFSVVTSRLYGGDPAGSSSVANFVLDDIRSGLTSFWIPAAINGDPNNNFQGVEEISAADLTTINSYLLSDWVGVGDTPDTTQSVPYAYFPSYSGFYTEYQDPDTFDLYSVIRYFGEAPVPPEPVSADVTARAWGFSLDGHEFYVLRADDKTFVFDRLTRQWSHWSNNGLDRWRPVCGINWRGMASTLADGGTDVVCGDEATGVLYRLDPAYGRDDKTDSGDQSFSRIVTGSIPVDGRESIPCNAVQITLGLGNPSQTGAALTLETSDNLGASYINHGTVTITSLDYTQVVEWRALGQIGQPGRLFRITDDGATVRIGRAQIR